MKQPDVKSVVVAGAFGAVLMLFVFGFLSSPTTSSPNGTTLPTTPAPWLVIGALLGAGVQVLVRVVGVS